MLGEPVSLRILLVDVDLTAVNSRVDVGIAVDTDKIIREPAVRHIHASSQAAGVARAETLGRGIAAHPHGKARVGAQHVSQIHADRKVDVLLDQAVALCAGVRVAGGIVPGIDEDSDCQ